MWASKTEVFFTVDWRLDAIEASLICSLRIRGVTGVSEFWLYSNSYSYMFIVGETITYLITFCCFTSFLLPFFLTALTAYGCLLPLRPFLTSMFSTSSLTPVPLITCYSSITIIFIAFLSDVFLFDMSSKMAGFE